MTNLDFNVPAALRDLMFLVRDNPVKLSANMTERNFLALLNSVRFLEDP